MVAKKIRTKIRHSIPEKFLSGFVHQSKRKKYKGSRSQETKRAIQEYLD